MLPDGSPLRPEDLALLASLQRGNDWLRSALCTLARRGVAFRQRDSPRARIVLDTLAPLPLYKGGQFLFDLMEWEDFMVDGEPPPLMATMLDATAQQRLGEALRTIRQQVDGAVANGTVPAGLAWPSPNGTNTTAPDDESLPPLEPGFYLYQDVVLGIVLSFQTLR